MKPFEYREGSRYTSIVLGDENDYVEMGMPVAVANLIVMKLLESEWISEEVHTEMYLLEGSQTKAEWMYDRYLGLLEEIGVDQRGDPLRDQAR